MSHPEVEHGHNTKTSTWICVALMILATIGGGIGLIEWQWVLFWISVGVMVIAAVASLATGIMDQVEEYAGVSPGGDPQAAVPDVIAT